MGVMIGLGIPLLPVGVFAGMITDSPVVTPFKTYQIEFGYSKSNATTAIGQLALRFGLFPKLECVVAPNSYRITESDCGFEDVGFGTKYQLTTDESDNFDSVLVGTSSLPTGHKGIGDPCCLTAVRIAVGKTVGDVTLTGEFGVQTIRTEADTLFGQPVVSGVASLPLSETVSGYVEMVSLGSDPEGLEGTSILDCGVTIVVNSQFQLDIQYGQDLTEHDQFINISGAVINCW